MTHPLTAFKELDGIKMHEEPDDRYFSAHWLTSVLIDPEYTGGITGKNIQNIIDKVGIETRPLWKPLHLLNDFKGFPYFTHWFSEHYFQSELCLPSSSNITDSELNQVTSVLFRLLRYRNYVSD